MKPPSHIPEPPSTPSTPSLGPVQEPDRSTGPDRYTTAALRQAQASREGLSRRTSHTPAGHEAASDDGARGLPEVGTRSSTPRSGSSKVTTRTKPCTTLDPEPLFSLFFASQASRVGAEMDRIRRMGSRRLSDSSRLSRQSKEEAPQGNTMPPNERERPFSQPLRHELGPRDDQPGLCVGGLPTPRRDEPLHHDSLESESTRPRPEPADRSRADGLTAVAGPEDQKVDTPEVGDGTELVHRFAQKAPRGEPQEKREGKRPTPDQNRLPNMRRSGPVDRVAAKARVARSAGKIDLDRSQAREMPNPNAKLDHGAHVDLNEKVHQGWLAAPETKLLHAVNQWANTSEVQLHTLDRSSAPISGMWSEKVDDERLLRNGFSATEQTAALRLFDLLDDGAGKIDMGVLWRRVKHPSRAKADRSQVVNKAGWLTYLRGKKSAMGDDKFSKFLDYLVVRVEQEGPSANLSA